MKINVELDKLESLSYKINDEITIHLTIDDSNTISISHTTNTTKSKEKPTLEMKKVKKEFDDIMNKADDYLKKLKKDNHYHIVYPVDETESHYNSEVLKKILLKNYERLVGDMKSTKKSDNEVKTTTTKSEELCTADDIAATSTNKE